MCTAGNLPVKWVFHSIILQPMRKASLKNLSRLDSIYTQILHAADKLDITSLAMPLIGAGRKDLQSTFYTRRFSAITVVI